MHTIEQTSPLAPYTVQERRPMFTRQWQIAQRATHWLVRNRVSPNMISVVGMMGSVAAGLALAASGSTDLGRVCFGLAVLGILVRGMGNLLDGMVAVESGKASRVGELFNEVPDRVSDVAILVGAGYAAGGSPLLGYWAAILAVLTAYVRAQGKVVGAPQDYCGPMAKPQRMLLIALGAIYCMVAPANMQPVVTFAGQEHGIFSLLLALVIAGGAWTVLRRLGRIARAVKRAEAEAL